MNKTIPSSGPCLIVRKYLTCVLKWFEAKADRCPKCGKEFILAYKGTKQEPVIVIVFKSNSTSTFDALSTVKKCLPVPVDGQVALAITDPFGTVSLYSMSGGIDAELTDRAWRPSKQILVNPEDYNLPGTSGPSRKRGRKNPNPVDIIVIDD